MTDQMTDQIPNNTSVPDSEPHRTPEEEKQFQEYLAFTKAEVEAFIADPRHERYKHGPENRQAMTSYLDEHKLEWTRDTLHLAFTELSKAGKLSLYAESKLSVEPEVQKPKPTTENPVEDLSFSIFDQQKGRRQVLEGPKSTRDVFIHRGQSEPPVRVKSQRFHL